jgi:exopolysaccharide biosynthesis predicted pyruvyltransferase EpsI
LAISQIRTPCLQGQHSEVAGHQEFQIVASASTTRFHASIMGQLLQTWWLVVQN